MRLINSLHHPLQADVAFSNFSVVTAWVQRMLHSSTVHASTVSSSSNYSTAASQQPQQLEQVPQQNSWKHLVRPQFSVRPSVLSPLHALHREAEEMQTRLAFLQNTMKAHLKLLDEIHPDELEKYSDSPDPVAAALAARRQQLQEVKKTYDKLRSELTPCWDPAYMTGYYTVLEKAYEQKDVDAGEFLQVLEGDRSVWDYWFKHFSPQYKGLPSLGSIEKIYNQADEEALLRQMAGVRSTAPKPPAMPKLDHLGRAAATGGRKTSRAQVFLWKGQGRILVNRKPIDAYFPDLLLRSSVLRPLSVTELTGQIDAIIQVDGGGVSGQAQAAAHGIAKALRRFDPGLKSALKAAGLLKRDPRAVERKKPGKAKARKSFTWVKR